MTTETWTSTLLAEVVWLARLRTTRWPKWRDSESDPAPRPVVFDATARLNAVTAVTAAHTLQSVKRRNHDRGDSHGRLSSQG